MGMKVDTEGMLFVVTNAETTDRIAYFRFVKDAEIYIEFLHGRYPTTCGYIVMSSPGVVITEG